MLLEISALCILAYMAYRTFLCSDPLVDVPGPTQWPLVGNMLQLDANKPFITLQTWAKKYGNVFKIKIGGDNTIVVTGKSAFQEMLLKRGDDFSNRPKIFRIEIFTHNYNDLGWMDVCEKQKWMRKALHRGLKLHNLNIIEKVTIESITEFAEEVKALNGKAFNPHELLHDTLLQILFVMILNQKLGKSSPEFALMKEIDETIVQCMSAVGSGTELDLFPWLRFFGNETYKRLKILQQKEILLYEMCKRKVESGECSEGWYHDLLNQLKIENPANLTETNELMLLFSFTIGGSVTTGSALYSFFNILAHNPDIQQHLQREADTVIGKDSLTISKRSDMPFTHAVVFELLRYCTVLPLGVPHCTSRDTELKGHHIPKGTQVLLNLWAHHHDEVIWPDPYTFKPDRFLNDDGSLILAGEYPRDQFFPFSAGTRECPGETLALTRMFLIVGTFAQHFTVLPETTVDEQVSCNPKDFELGIVLYPKPYKVRMIQRGTIQ